MSRKLSKNKLSDTQRQVAEIFATNDVHNLTVDQIAEKAGVSRRTIYRWKRLPEFVEYQNSIAEQAMDDFLNEAYIHLKKLLKEGKSEKTQLDAVRLVLQTRGKLKDSHEHTHKVEETRSLDELEAEVIEMEQELLDNE